MAKHLYSFYRPHKRVVEDNLSVDPMTGELEYLPSMTKQEFQAECDINNVVKSFSATGMFKHVSVRAALGTYEDLPDPSDFQHALHEVQRARDAFMTLPSKIRSRFGNDPQEFLAFTSDPSNLDELRTLGLANPAPPPIAPVAVTIAPTTPTGGEGGSPPSQAPKAP